MLVRDRDGPAVGVSGDRTAVVVDIGETGEVGVVVGKGGTAIVADTAALPIELAPLRAEKGEPERSLLGEGGEEEETLCCRAARADDLSGLRGCTFFEL